MNSPLFSIITVTLNNLTGLQKTYRSVQFQSSYNFEWLVMDGGSTDGTIDYLKEKKVTPAGISDSGIYDAMNKGIKHAKGTYLIFMNAGDIFASTETLQTLANTIEDHKLDFIYGDALEILNGKEIYKKANWHELIINGMPTHHQSMIYKRKSLNNLRYDLRYKIAADYDFTFRFLKNAKNIEYVPAPLCLFESGGLSERNAFKGRLEQFKIRNKLKINIFKNIYILCGQTILYRLRRLSPHAYWRLKSFLTRL